jgi:hypothetical protein
MASPAQAAPFAGILMLDTTFERFPGDVGHPATWSIPTKQHIVPGATAAAITTLDDDRFLVLFTRAAQTLVAEGARLITTSCGFLALYQMELAARLAVPVVTSALLDLPRLAADGARPGVLTFDDRSLSGAHLRACGADPATPITGLVRDGVFRRAILGDPTDDSFAAREAEAVDAARRLVATHPEIDAIVLECTNLPPHRGAIEDATRRPVFDIVGLVERVWCSGR